MSLKKLWKTILQWWNRNNPPTPPPKPPQPVPEPIPPAPVPTPSPTPAPAVDEFTGCVIHTAGQDGQSVASWAEADTLAVTYIGNKVRFTLGHPELWPEHNGVVACVGAVVFREGKWHWGPADYLGSANYVKNYGDAAVMPEGDNKLYVPAKGEKFYWAVTGLCRRGKPMEPKIRTNLVPAVGR